MRQKVGARQTAAKKNSPVARAMLLAMLTMKAKALCAILVPVVVVAGYALWPKSGTAKAPSSKPVAAAPGGPRVANQELQPVVLPPTEVVDLMSAIETGTLKVEARG